MLRAAVDVSFLAKHHARPAAIAGVTRAAHELVAALAGQPQLDLTLIAACAFDEIRAGSLTAAYARRLSYTFAVDRGFRSRIRSERLYERLALRLEPDGTLRSRVASLSARGAFKALKRVDARRTFDGSRYDVIHSTFLPLPGRQVTGRAARVISVFDLIPLDHPSYATPEQRAFAELVVERIGRRDWVVVASSYARDRVVERTAVDPNRVAIVPLGVSDAMRPVDPISRRRALQRYGIPDAPYILTLAARQPRKNLALAIRAFERLVERGAARNVNLVLAGPRGWDTDETDAELRKRSRLRSRMIETGFVADSDLPALYSGAELLAFPSRAEGFGLPVLEAMRCDTPVVAAAATSLPEVAGDAALFVDPDDVDALANAFDQLLHDDMVRKLYRERGRRRSLQFTWQRCARETAATYRRAAAARDA